MSQRRAAGSSSYLFDGLGSVVGLADGSGTLVARYGYDPYGQEVLKQGPPSNPSNTAAADANPFRYTGAYLDGTGLYKLGERYYDPARGRFTQLDPAGTGYGYASDNPANVVDPTGLDGCIDDGTPSAASCGPQNFGDTLGGSGGGGGSATRGFSGSSVYVDLHIYNDLADCGWTIDDIVNVARNPAYERPAMNFSTGDFDYTAYYGSDGYYVVIDDSTGRVIQISNRGDPGWVDNTQGPGTNEPIQPRP